MITSDTPLIPQAAAEAPLRLAGRLIDAFGPRPSGCAASRQAADALHLEFVYLPSL